MPFYRDRRQTTRSLRTRLNEHVRSNLQERKLVFPSYDHEELYEIIHSYLDTFGNGTLPDDVIAECTSLAVEEHSDVHKAINLLRDAGELIVNDEINTARWRTFKNIGLLAKYD